MVDDGKNLKEAVYQSLKDDILSLKRKPGEQLMETKIANEFSVSRTPVREALGMLEMEGYIEPLASNGFLVKDVSYKDMLETFYIRILLEAGAAKLAAPRIMESDIEDLKIYNDYKDTETIWENNKKFHMVIARASANSRLIEIIERSIDDIKRFLMLDPHMNVMDPEDNNEHENIIKALERGDSQLAGKVMEEHLVSTRKRICECLY